MEDSLIHPAVTVRDGQLIIEVKFSEIVAIVEDHNQGLRVRKKNTVEKVKVFDEKTFAEYLARYLQSSPEIGDAIDDAVGMVLDDADYMGAGVKKYDDEHPEPKVT